MMRLQLVAPQVLCVAIAACSAPDAERSATSDELRVAIVDSGLGARLDSLDAEMRAHLQRISPRVGGDTLHLYSPRDHRTPGPMVGTPVGSAVERYFGSRFGLAMSQSHDIFAIGWFPVGPAHEAYLLRTMSQYDASAITLWVYDKQLRTWRGSFQLADQFGDEGWSFEKEAWMREVPDSGDVVFTVARRNRNIDIDDEDAKVKIGPDSLYTFSTKNWIRGTWWTKQLPDSLRAGYSLFSVP